MKLTSCKTQMDVSKILCYDDNFPKSTFVPLLAVENTANAKVTKAKHEVTKK